MPATDKPAEPWERRPGESLEAFEGFAVYRDAGRSRGTAGVAQALGKSKTLIDRWCARDGWVRRVAAYERHLDSERRREQEQQLVDMSRRQGVQLAAAAQALAQPARAFLERIQQARDRGEDPFARMSTAELGRLAVSAVRHLGSVVEAERLVAGLSTENVQPDAPATVEDARRRAEAMSRGELDDYLLGVDDGRREFLRELGLDDSA
jgi:hypothetical protein